jgi:hypothetical protein
MVAGPYVDGVKIHVGVTAGFTDDGEPGGKLGTGASSVQVGRGQVTEGSEDQPRLMFRPPAGDAAANPYRMVLFGTCPIRRIDCPVGTPKLTVVEALETPVPEEMKHVLAPPLVTTRSRWYALVEVV